MLDADDLKHWWWKHNEGVRETTRRGQNLISRALRLGG
jgi:hypothetical protein